MNRGWARDYWRKSLFRPSSWWRGLTGRIHYRRLATVLARQLKGRFASSSQENDERSPVAHQIEGLVERGVHLLFVHTEGDHAKDFFDAILADRISSLEASGHVSSRVEGRTDHTFTLLESQERLNGSIEDWFATRDWERGRAQQG
jgi:hypothetical protein